MDLTQMINDLLNSFVVGFLLSSLLLVTYFFGYGARNIISFFKKISD